MALKLASDLNAGLILTNLDYVFDERTYELRAFDSKISNEVERIVKQVENEAKSKGIPFKRPLFRSKELAVCDAFPESAIVFSVEGDVFSLCLSKPPLRESAEMLQGERDWYKQAQIRNITEKSLDDIWHSEFYFSFRERFTRRIKTTKGIRYILGFSNLFSELSKLTAPECCRGCYKLYGI